MVGRRQLDEHGGTRHVLGGRTRDVFDDGITGRTNDVLHLHCHYDDEGLTGLRKLESVCKNSRRKMCRLKSETKSSVLVTDFPIKRFYNRAMTRLGD